MHIIALEKEDNPEYYKLGDEFNLIMDKWNDLNARIINFKIPRIWLFGKKKKIISIGKEISSLQKQFSSWQERTANFYIAPHFIFCGNDNNDKSFIHYTNVLQYLLKKLNSNMTLIAENYNKVYASYESKINFNIAITSFLVSFGGLILGIITFL